MISTPVAVILFVSLAAGGWLLITARRASYDAAEHCMTCGYNLTGLTSDLCPECGTRLTVDNRMIGEPSAMGWERFLLGFVLVAGPLIYALGRAFSLL
jgi:hypothetical protein